MKITIQDGERTVSVERPVDAESIHGVLYGLVIPALHGLGYGQDLVSRLVRPDEDKGYDDLHRNDA